MQKSKAKGLSKSLASNDKINQSQKKQAKTTPHARVGKSLVKLANTIKLDPDATGGGGSGRRILRT